MRKRFLPERLEKKLDDDFHKLDFHDFELYQFLSENLDEGGRPQLDDIQFVQITDKYGRNVFRRTLADYITRKKPDFPYQTWTKEEVIDKFHKLVKYDWEKWISKRDREDVLEKYDDYKYSYNKWGLGIIDAPPMYNSISDSFMKFCMSVSAVIRPLAVASSFNCCFSSSNVSSAVLYSLT